MDLFDKLLEEDEFVQRQWELARQEGQLAASKEVLVSYIRIRYPPLLGLAQQYIKKTAQKAVLRDILNMIFAAPDEATVRFILIGSITSSVKGSLPHETCKLGHRKIG